MSLILAFRGKCLGEKCIFSKFEQIGYDFSVFTPKLLQKHFESVPFERRRKILKKSIFLINALSTFCGISVNILNCQRFISSVFTRKW